jgi:hypothetical protein
MLHSQSLQQATAAGLVPEGALSLSAAAAAELPCSPTGGGRRVDAAHEPHGQAIQQVVRFSSRVAPTSPRSAIWTTWWRTTRSGGTPTPCSAASGTRRSARTRPRHSAPAPVQLQGGVRQAAVQHVPARPGRRVPYPFDDDWPFWVIPWAVGFARALGVSDTCSVSPLLRARGGE